MNSKASRSRLTKLFGTMCMALLLSGQLAFSRVEEVHCDKDAKKIADVLAKAEPGDTIRIVGTCTERLTITTDGITLDGQGSGILNGGGRSGGSFGGVIVINGAHRVVITGLTLWSELRGE